MHGKCLMLLVAAVAAGSVLGATHVDKRDFIYLSADDPGATYSWSTQLGRWFDGQTDSATGVGAPDANHDYLVTGGKVLRGYEAKPFAGRLLVLDDGGKIKNPNPEFTLLRVYDGIISQNDAGITVGNIKGPIELADGGSCLQFEIAPKRCYRLMSAVTGGVDSVLMVSPENSIYGFNADFPYAHLRLDGDNTGFKGKIVARTITSGVTHFRSALSVSRLTNLGAGDPSADTSIVELDAGSLFFGCGLEFTDSAYSISAKSGATVGSMTNLAGVSGLTLGGGAKIKVIGDTPILNVSNIVGRTKLAYVAFESAAGLTIRLQSGETVFGSAYNQPGVTIFVGKGAKMTVETGATLGSIVFEDPADKSAFSCQPTVDSTWYTNNVAFSVAVFSSPSLSDENPTLGLGDLDCYAGVPREQLKIEAGTLYLYRDADTHPVRWMKESDSANGSFAAGTGWCDGVAPTAENDYVVQNGRVLRARDSGKTFAGHALRILQGGDLSLHVGATVNGLELYEGGWTLVRGESTATLSGSCSVYSSADGYAGVQVEGGKYTIASTLGGSGNLRYFRYGVKDYHGDVWVTADNSDLTGKVWVGNTDRWGNGVAFSPTSSNQLRVYFKDEKAIGGNPAKFVVDGLTLSPYVTFTCSADYPAEVANANRGVTLLGEASKPVCFDVADGQTCRILSKVSGSGRLTKRGAGTLTLGGANTFAGGAALEAGVLKVVNGAALSGSCLLFTAGTTLRVECADPVRIASGAEPPIALASGEGKLTVTHAAWDSSNANVSLFLFPNETTERITPEWLEARVSLPQLTDYRWVVTETAAGVLVTCKVRKGLLMFVR